MSKIILFLLANLVMIVREPRISMNGIQINLIFLMNE